MFGYTMYGKQFIDGVFFDMRTNKVTEPMNRKFPKRISPIVVVFVSVLVSFWWMGVTLHAKEITTSPSNPLENESLMVDAVVLQPFQVTEVPAQQTGLLQSFSIQEGEQVQAGQVLASLDARAVQHELRQAELEHELATLKVANEIHLRFAKKALEVAQAELARSNESIEQFAKSISKSQLDVERLTVEKLLLESEQAQHELKIEHFGQELKHNSLEMAQLRLDQHKLRAPFSGIVALVRGHAGEWVEVGRPVIRLVAVDRLRAEGFMLAERLRKVDKAHQTLVGRPVRIRVTLSDSQMVECHGTLRFVSPEMDPVSRQVRIWAEVKNDQQQLRPGQRGQMEVLMSDE
jgi:RND family efflux transporter MFP subunit